MMKKIFLLTLVLTVLTVTAAGAKTLGIGTTGPGSLTHSTGSAIARIVADKTGLQMRIQPHGGNNVAVPATNAGEVDFTVASNYELHDAMAGTGIYKGQVLSDLRAVCVLMPLRNTFWVQKDSPIKTLKDLKGKRVPGVFASQKIVGLLTTALLANAGLTWDDVKMVPVPNVLRNADDFAANRVDAFFFAIGSGKVREVGAKVGGLRGLPVDPSPEAMARARKIVPVIYPLTVEPSKANYGILEPTIISANDFIFITSTKVSEDIVYQITKAIYGGKKAMLASFKPLGATFAQENMAKILPAGEYHPGAIKFYKEVGLWPPKK
jgi:TRAP transporter TAXI family solute receptor